MKAKLLALTAVILWSTAATVFKITLRYIPPYLLVLLASTVSLAVLSLILLFRRRSSGSRGSGFRAAAVRGLLNPFLYYLVLLEAYDRLPAQVAMVINYLWPIVLVLLSVPLLHQKITGRILAATGLCFCGVAVMALGGSSILGSLSPSAMGLALLSTVIWALFWLITLRSSGDQVVALAGGFGFGVLYLLAAGLLTGGLAGLRSIPWQGFAGATCVGLFEMGITFVVWLRALSLARSTAEVGSLVYLTPFLSLVFIGTAAGEVVSPWTVAGLGLVISGIAFQSRRSRPGHGT
jgi:drug/metabolite transporter (DMT)-like permease